MNYKGYSMKSRNIPDDIKTKSIKEAQLEVFAILEILEKQDNIGNLLEKYHRLIHLNNYIEQKFKDKSKQIFQTNITKLQNSPPKD